MDVGTGIFLGLIFFSLTYAFVNSGAKQIFIRRLLKWGLLLPILLSVLIGGGLYLIEKWNSRPQVITSLRGISLGERLSDVMFKNGEFHLKKDTRKEPELSTAGTVITDSTTVSPDEEEYEDNSYTSLTIKANKVSDIMYICNGTDYTDLNGISCRDNGEKIINKFGNDIRIQCMKPEDGNDKFARVSRAYDDIDNGVRYILVENQVRGFLVTSAERLKSYTNKNWTECK